MDGFSDCLKCGRVFSAFGIDRLIEDTLRLRSEEAVMSEVCDMSPLLQVKVVMAVICWEWPLSSCSLSPV